jgi:hypothetical protein
LNSMSFSPEIASEIQFDTIQHRQAVTPAKPAELINKWKDEQFEDYINGVSIHGLNIDVQLVPFVGYTTTITIAFVGK